MVELNVIEQCLNLFKTSGLAVVIAAGYVGLGGHISGDAMIDM
jgi:hypothetical protein